MQSLQSQLSLKVGILHRSYYTKARKDIRAIVSSVGMEDFKSTVIKCERDVATVKRYAVARRHLRGLKSSDGTKLKNKLFELKNQVFLSLMELNFLTAYSGSKSLNEA